MIISLGEAGPQNVHLLSPEKRFPAEAKLQVSAGKRLGAYFFQPTPLQEQRHCPQHDRLRSFEERLPLLQLPIGWGPPNWEMQAQQTRAYHPKATHQAWCQTKSTGHATIPNLEQ